MNPNPTLQVQEWRKEAERLIDDYASAPITFGLNNRWANIQAHLAAHPFNQVVQEPPPLIEITVDARMGETAPEYQLRLTIGVQSFTICQPRETMSEATWLMDQFSKALGAAGLGVAASQPGEPSLPQSGQLDSEQPDSVKAHLMVAVGSDLPPALAEPIKHVADRLDGLRRAMRTMPVNERSFNEIASLMDSLAYVLREGIKGGQQPDISVMVNRFLGWPLPKTFGPDCGISFKPLAHPNSWPIGTNLLTADEARQMFEHALAPQCSLAPPGWQCTRLAGHEGPCAAREARVEPIAGLNSGPPRSDKAVLPADLHLSAPVEVVEVMSAQRYVDGVPQFNPSAKCSPTLTQCPRCNNPHHACDTELGTLVAQPPQAGQEDERDAKRYRFLRAWEARRWRLFVSNGNNPLYHAALDDAVDAAMAATTKQES